MSADPVQVVVFNDGDRGVGMVVDEIVDVAEEAVTIRRKSGRRGILGSAVVGKRVTDFLDLNQVIAAAKENWFQTTDTCPKANRVLIADPSAFSRGLIRSGLDMAGYLVFESANISETIQSMEHRPVDIVLAAMNLPDGGGSDLLAAMRRRPGLQNIPVIAIAASSAEFDTPECRAAGFQDCQASLDSNAILDSVARLVSAPVSDEVAFELVGEKR
jgi:two-component system chemotaxis sensor kinase CheA